MNRPRRSTGEVHVPARPGCGLGRVAARTAVVVLSGAALVACGSGTSGPTGTVVPLQTTVPGSAVPATERVRLACTADSLSPEVVAAHPGVTISNESCDSSNAVVTYASADTADRGVAFLRAGATSWVLVSSGPLEDADGLRPADFPESLLRTWRFRLEQSLNPTTTTTRPPSDQATVPTMPDGLIQTAKTTTTTAPPTTTTTTTTPPETAPTASPFCQVNPQFPDCRTDPFFPGP